jgi:hypothetical protein
MFWNAHQLSDTAFSSSSDFNKNHAAKLCRLNSVEGKANWSAKTNDQNQWLQLDLGHLETIVAVAIQGRFNSPQWVKKYNLLISQDEINWERIENVNGANDQETVAVFQLPRSVNGRFIRFVPLEWHKHISMRVDVATSAIDILWVGSSITDDGFSSSSDFNEEHAAKFGKLNLKTGKANWSAKANDKNQWIQLDIGKIQSIAAVAVQGRFNYKQWVSKYDLHISSDLKDWEKFENISGSANQETVAEFQLPQPIQGRYVRFLPQEWHKHISMRVDVCVKTSSSDFKTVEKGLKKDNKTVNSTQEKENSKIVTERKERRVVEDKIGADSITPKNDELEAKKEAEEKTVNFKPIIPTKAWQPFFKEVCRKLHPNNINFIDYYDKRGDFDKSNFDSNPLPNLPQSGYSSDPVRQIERNFTDLDRWFDFLIKEEYLLTAPAEENWILTEIGKVINFDKNKLDKIYGPGRQVIGELPKELIESRKNYPILLKHILSRIIKMDRIPIDGWLWSAINHCEPEVYKNFVEVYLTFSYEDTEKYYLASNFLWLTNGQKKRIPIVYRDFLKAYMAVRDNLDYRLSDIPKFHELKMWEVNLGHNLFCNYILDFFWTRPDLRNFKSFDEILNKIEKEKLHYFNTTIYNYINPNSWQDIELWIRHIRLLEFLVLNGRDNLADELYMDKMEYENRFKK